MDATFTKYVQQIDLKSWSDFKSKVDSFTLEWIYRGQANASLGLSSSLERSSLVEIDHDVEIVLIAEYRKAIRSFPDYSGTPETTLEWLSLLQHHGTPTRLIDFTYSPYIAAYFAFQEEGCEKSELVAIWCVSRIRFYQAALYYMKEHLKISDHSGRQYLFSESTFENLFGRTNIDCVMPFDLTNANQRQLIQQSVFVAAMNPEKRFVDQLSFLDYQEKPIMMKLTIPRKERKLALRDLMKMNITHATLFPGIDGFARSLYLKYSTLATLGEIGKWIQGLKRDGFIM
ncbi:MAG: FRG domain-containing protein [Deltaproteobacteria bacterium]|nr:FRG domain-containing protein [Deltaproteobacteria bacterium]